MVGVEGMLNFVLHFASAREEAALEEFLGLEVDGVLGNFTADDVANISTEISVKGGGPSSKCRIQVSNSVSDKFRGGGCGCGDEGSDCRNEGKALLNTPVLNFRVYLADSLVEKGLTVDPSIKHGGKGSHSGQVGGCGEVHGLNAVEAMSMGDWVVFIQLSEEVKDPA